MANSKIELTIGGNSIWTVTGYAESEEDLVTAARQAWQMANGGDTKLAAAPQGIRPRSTIPQCRRWLEEYLEGHPEGVRGTTVYADGLRAGFTHYMVTRASRDLNVDKRPHTFQGALMWTLNG